MGYLRVRNGKGLLSSGRLLSLIGTSEYVTGKEVRLMKEIIKLVKALTELLRVIAEIIRLLKY